MGIRIDLRYSDETPAFPHLRRIERLALADRRSLDCRFGEPCDPRKLVSLYDVCRILETYEEYGAHFDRSLKGEFDGLHRWSGVTFPIGNGDYLMTINPLHSRPRRTLTVAHEFGHLAFGHRPIHIGDNGELPKTRYNDEQEREAYGYALAILMPYAPLLQMLVQGASVRGVAHHYKVSVSAVEFRLKTGGLWGLARKHLQTA